MSEITIHSAESKGTTTKRHDHKIHLFIMTPVGKWQHPFKPTTTVLEVISRTVEHFGDALEPANYELREKDATSALRPDMTLAEIPIAGKTHLVLVPETGGGK